MVKIIYSNKLTSLFIKYVNSIKNFFTVYCQFTANPSNRTDELKISNKITLKTKKSPPAKAIGSVVPHPGATFPYSEFRGFKRFPKTVCFPLIAAIESYLLILFVLKKYVL